MTTNNTIRVETQMMIRKPVDQVFQAFIDPAITTNFWFTKSSGLLEAGKTITWEWEMYGVSINVVVKEIIPNQKIATEWGDPAVAVDYEFTALDAHRTYVVIKSYGFTQTGTDLIEVIKDNTGGFTTVLDGLKAYLEYNMRLNLIADKFPKEVMAHGNQ
ncbi:SRPBCC family protein [Flavisolibacter tropicus]|uniref:Polyketide cyclase n=1 Tax=Flavisolibacter tropicus TaxID=1492898 RepID=A0A172TZ14_9BACT|nr:SRPBCC family protein [Flavisolibacter tropicus]ANE52290.1 polyketide cyclase [Flavisolibacter tropicus]